LLGTDALAGATRQKSGGLLSEFCVQASLLLVFVVSFSFFFLLDNQKKEKCLILSPAIKAAYQGL
jgi:hypothetical protein